MSDNNLLIQNLYNNFSPAQLKIITDGSPVKQVIAAAGSGKTRTVTGLISHRLISGMETADRILLLSFSRKAAAELKERIPEEFREILEISTFHSFAFRWITALHPVYSGRDIRIIQEKEKFSFYEKYFRNNSDIIGGIPFHLLMEDDALFIDLFPDLHKKISAEFLQYKEKNNFLEYNDLIRILVTDLQNSESYMEKLRSKYSLIVVDEFQDTDPEQLTFLKLMSFQELVVVGDDWQAIYAFRGASVEPFLNFKKIFRNTKLFYLSENYRSHPEIVSLGNHVIRFSKKQMSKKVSSVRKIKSNNSVVACSMNSGHEYKILEMIPEEMPFRILTRSNRRRQEWIRSGSPEDSVMTIHKSKGLEFDCVILDITGGWSGYNPSSEPGEKHSNDEEIRIAYVGLTRAKNRLIVLYDPDAPPDRGQGALYGNLFSGKVKQADHEKIKKILRSEK